MAEQKINRNYLVIGGLALATILAMVLIRVFDPSSSSGPEASPIVEELSTEILDLESSILELELVYTEKDRELDNMIEIVDQKNDRLQAMEQRIDQLEREGKLDKATIARLRAQVKRVQQITESREKINQLVREQSAMTRVLDSVQRTLYTSDSALQVAEARLVDCSGLDGSDRGPEDVVPMIFADDVRVYNVDDKGRATEVDREIKKDKINTLRVCFNLRGNSLVTSLGGENKKACLILRSVGGTVYWNPNLAGREATIEGKPMVVTSINKLAKRQGSTYDDICFEYFSDGESEYKAGLHYIDIYYDGERLGGSSKKLYFLD